MFSFTRKTDYALVALACLAGEEAESDSSATRMSARQIAEKQEVPLPLLMNVLKDLVGGGLVESTRGARGGYSLARPAHGITVHDVVNATEGGVRVMNCCSTDENESCQECQLTATCPITDSMRRVNDSINAFLTQVTLEDLLNPHRIGPVLPEGTAASRGDR